jgi:prepilin-type N-terminal cleavage/methylation domain-containing protein
MKLPHNLDESKGFTLIECLLALFIFAFSLVGLAFLMAGTMQTDIQARRMSAATALAQQQLDQLHNTAYSAVASSTVSQSLNEAGGTTGPAFYLRSWTVTNNSPQVGMSTVTVRVDWTDKSASHHVSLQTILTP